MATRDAAPHVFLIGWTGCTPRHLQKYADIWSSEGVTKTTLVLELCDGPSIRLSSGWFSRLEREAADVLAQMVDGAPIIVHEFLISGARAASTVTMIGTGGSPPGRHARQPDRLEVGVPLSSKIRRA